MKPRLSSLLVLAIALGLASEGHAQQVGVSNLGNTSSGSADFGPVAGFFDLATSFTTGAGSGWILSSAVLRVDVLVGSPSNQIGLQLWIDNGVGTPGASLGSFLPVSPTGGIGVHDYTFNPASTLSLLANRTYWLVGSYPVAGEVRWSLTADHSETGLTGWTMGNTGMVNHPVIGWSDNTNGAPHMFEVNVQAVPEPTTWALMGLGFVAAGCGVWNYRRRHARLLDQPVEAS